MIHCNTSECKHYMQMNSEADIKTGICKIFPNYSMVQEDMECPLMNHKYTCGQCDHYVSRDTACMLAKEDDAVADCPGFEDHRIVELKEYLYEMRLMGVGNRQMKIILGDIVNEVMKENVPGL